jgi:hypothetical protein
MGDKATRTRLYHSHPGEKQEDFFKRIDEFGGWPVGKRYVIFAHTDERECEFSDNYVSTGWWTTICDADEYYTWKLSPEGKAKIMEKAKERIINSLRGMKL